MNEAKALQYAEKVYERLRAQGRPEAEARTDAERWVLGNFGVTVRLERKKPAYASRIDLGGITIDLNVPWEDLVYSRPAPPPPPRPEVLRDVSNVYFTVPVTVGPVFPPNAPPRAIHFFDRYNGAVSWRDFLHGDIGALGAGKGDCGFYDGHIWHRIGTAKEVRGRGSSLYVDFAELVKQPPPVKVAHPYRHTPAWVQVRVDRGVTMTYDPDNP